MELKRALPPKLSVAPERKRSRTSSMPPLDEKNAVCSSRKFALIFVSVLDIMIMPIRAALISISISSATTRATPRSEVLRFLP